MAGKREIKTQLKLEGEAQFKKGMSDAANALKVLDSEQKLAKAQFEATGDAEQYAADKARILKEKIEQQQRAVEYAEKAVKQLTDDGVNPNSKAMQTWKTKLNNAKTSLTRMESELNDTESALDDQGTAFDNTTTDAGEYKDQMDVIAKGVDFSATITAIDNVRDRLATIIKAAAGAAKAMWEMEVGAGQWADEISTAAQVADMDVETYQAWQYASRFVDVSVDSIIGAYKRLNKNLGKPTDDMLHELNELTVANLNLNGTARDSMDVFWDVIDALGRVEDKSRRDQLAMDLFGKSFDELNPLIKAGSKEFLGFAEEGRAVAVVSAENVEALAMYDDANQKLNATWEKTRNTLLSELAPAFTTIANTMQTALEEFNAFMETEEGQEALANLNEAIAGIADQVASVDFKKGLEDAKKLINGVTKGLGWIADHSDVVVGAIAAMGGAWAALTVSKDVLSVLQLMDRIKWSQISKVAASGTSGAGGVPGKTGFWGKLKSGAVSAFGAAKSAAPTIAQGVLPAAALTASVLAGSKAYEKKLLSDLTTELNDAQQATEALAEASGDSRLENLAKISGELSEGRLTGWHDFGNVVEAFEALKKIDVNGILSDETLDRYERFINPSTNDLDQGEVTQLLQDITDEVQSYVAKASTMGGDVASGIAEDISSHTHEAVDASATMAEQVTAAADSINTETIGYNVGAGLAAGINDSFPLAVGAAEAMGDAVAGRLRQVLMIRSPSKVMESLGAYVSEGFAMGIEENVARVERATSRMVKATTMGMSAAPRNGAGANGGGMVHITLVMDGQEVADLITPYVDSNIGASIQKRR